MRRCRVKCVDTGEYSTNDIAYKGDDGKYYSTAEAYQTIKLEQEKYKRCVAFMFSEVMGYESGAIMTSRFYKRLKEWKTFYPYDVIFETMQMCYEKSKYYVNSKTFNSEDQRCNYWCAIFENHLQDVYLKYKSEQVAIAKTIAVSETDMDTSAFDEDIATVSTGNKRNIAKWLEE